MIEKLTKFTNNVIERLITMGECCQIPRYLENYLRTVPEVSGYQVSNSLVDNWEKEIVQHGAKSKVAKPEESPAISNSVMSDEVLVSK